MLSKRKQSLRLVAGVAVLAMAAAACGSDKKESATTTSAATTSSVEVPKGGTLLVGAEQEPDCVDWISSCAGSSWGYWMMGVTTMPRVYDTMKDGDKWMAMASSLVTEEPKIDLADPAKPVVTYKLNPKAVWSDGVQITCDDFAYTWDAIANGKDIYDPTGYTDIEKVDCTDQEQPVVTFKKPVTGWKGLFGGGYGIYPSHILKGKDHVKEMSNGYSWSGGPWTIQKWEKGVSVTLVPNTKYWGTQAKLDKVVFRFQTDTAAEFQAFKGNEVSVIYPQPQIDAVEQIKAGIEGAQSQYSADTGNIEALWINNAKEPFTDVNVRKAFAYAIDRDGVVNALFGALGVKSAMQTLNPPILSDFSDTTAWSQYKQDLTKVDELMTGAGWAKNSAGFWEKAGKQADIEIKSTSGNKRREATEKELQSQLKAAGFNLTINNQKAGDLFGDQLPKGDYTLSLYAQVSTFISPGQCNLFCSKNIPGPANDNGGQNWQRVNIPALDPLLEEIDKNLDESVQKAKGKEADKLQADNMISLPLDPLPNILIWSNKVVGPVADNPVLGPFVNMNEWGVQS